MKVRHFLIVSLATLALASGCARFTQDDPPPGYGDYENVPIADPQEAGINDKYNEGSPHQNDKYMEGSNGGTHMMDNVGGSDDSAEVPFSATRRPGESDASGGESGADASGDM